MSFKEFFNGNANPASSFGAIGNKFGGFNGSTPNNSFKELSRSSGLTNANNSFSNRPINNSSQISNSVFGSSLGSHQNSIFSNNSNVSGIGNNSSSSTAFGASNTSGFGNGNLNQGFGSSAIPSFGSTGSSGLGNHPGVSGSSGFGNTSGGGLGSQSQGFNNSGFSSGTKALSSFGSSTQMFGERGGGGSPFQNSSSPFSARPSTVTSGVGSDIGSSKYNSTPSQVIETIQGRPVSQSLHHICSVDPYKGKSQEEIHLEDLQGKSAIGPQPSQFSMPTSTFSSSQSQGQAPDLSFNINQQPAQQIQQITPSAFGGFNSQSSTPFSSLGFNKNASQPLSVGTSVSSSQSPFGAQTTLQPAPGFLNAANSQQPIRLNSPSPFGGTTPSSSYSTFPNSSMNTQINLLSNTQRNFSALSTPPQQGLGFMNLPTTASQPAASTFTSPFNLMASSSHQTLQSQPTLSNFSFPQNSQSSNTVIGHTPSFSFPSSQNANSFTGQFNNAQSTQQIISNSQPSSVVPPFSSNAPSTNPISSLSQKIMFIKNKTQNSEKGSLEYKKETEVYNMTPRSVVGSRSSSINSPVTMPMSYRSSARIAPSTLGRYYPVAPPLGRVVTSNSNNNSSSSSNINRMGFTSRQDSLIGQSPRRLVINKTTPNETSWVTLRPSLQTLKTDFILEQQPTRIDDTNLVKDATYEFTENNRNYEDESEESSESSGTIRNHECSKSPSLIKSKQFGPKLTRHNYFTEPPIEILNEMDEDDLSHVSGFKIFKYDDFGKIVGMIEWDEFVNLVELDLDAIVTINHGKIEISNPDGKRPKYGEGLNKSAKISLYGMAPKLNKSIDEYVKKLENICEQMGTEFLAYDPDWGGGNGLWQFRTNDFCDKNQ